MNQYDVSNHTLMYHRNLLEKLCFHDFPLKLFSAYTLNTEKKNLEVSKVVSPHLWYTPLNLYQPAIKGFLS